MIRIAGKRMGFWTRSLNRVLLSIALEDLRGKVCQREVKFVLLITRIVPDYRRAGSNILSEPMADRPDNEESMFRMILGICL